jgi:hypothetical protein
LHFGTNERHVLFACIEVVRRDASEDKTNETKRLTGKLIHTFKKIGGGGDV